MLTIFKATKRNKMLIAILVLILASLACQTLTGGGPTALPTVEATQAVTNLPTVTATALSSFAPTDMPFDSPTQAITTDGSEFDRPTNVPYVAPSQDGLDLNCDGVRTDTPCEPRKIRIRGYENPTSVGPPIAGQSYGWFPIAEGIPWIIGVHSGIGTQGIFPVGYSFDAGTLMQFEKEEGGYYYVTHPEHPGVQFTLSTSEVTSQTKPSAPFFMKTVTASWCPVNPADGSSTLITVGQSYPWFGLGYKVQFNYVEKYPNAEALMASGVDPDIMADGGELVPVQDFTVMEFVTTTTTRKPWVRYNGELLFAPNSFCNYWVDSAP